MTREAEQIAKARTLRAAITPAEKLLWRELRNRRFAGFKFRRQHPIGPYIADFYCAAFALVIELDGESHLTRQEQDRVRTAFMAELGITVIRLWNTEIFKETEAVLEAIYQECCRLKARSVEERLGSDGSKPLTPDPSPRSTGARGEEENPAPRTMRSM